jgi:hypothetical protein
MSRLPATPFAGDGSYRFEYWEELGRIPLGGVASVKDKGTATKSGQEEILVALGFNPASEYSSFLGLGWNFPLFDSRLEWENAQTLNAYLPDGHVESFKRVRSGNTLRGSRWIAEIKGKQAVLRASCGWVLTYGANNRLLSMRTPDGILLEPRVLPNGTRSLVSGGKILLTLKPDWDKVTTQKVYHLNFSMKSALVKMGKRPVLVKKKGQLDKQVEVDTVASILFKDGKEKSFVFKQNEVLVAGRPYKWDNKTFALRQDGEKLFSQVKVMGVNCLQTQYLNNSKSTIFGYDRDNGLKVEKSHQGFVISEMFTTGNQRGNLKRIYALDANGDETTIRQLWYDEKNVVCRLMMKENGSDVLYFAQNNSIIAKDVKNNIVKWQKTYDSDGRMTIYSEGGRNFFFDYSLPEKIKVTVIKEKQKKTFFLPLTNNIQRMLIK